MIQILVKTKSNCKRTSAAVCYVNLFFAEIYSATYFCKIRWNQFFPLNHVCGDQSNSVDIIGCCTIRHFQDLALMLLKQVCLQLSLFKSPLIYGRVWFDPKIDTQAS